MIVVIDLAVLILIWILYLAQKKVYIFVIQLFLNLILNFHPNWYILFTPTVGYWFSLKLVRTLFNVLLRRHFKIKNFLCGYAV